MNDEPTRSRGRLIRYYFHFTATVLVPFGAMLLVLACGALSLDAAYEPGAGSAAPTGLVMAVALIGVVGVSCLLPLNRQAAVSAGYLLPSLLCAMYVLTPRAGIIVDTVSGGLMPGLGLGLPLSCFVLMLLILTTDGAAPPVGNYGSLFATLCGIAVLRGWWSALSVLHDQVLVKTDDGWFVVSIGGWREKLRRLSFAFIDLECPIAPCDVTSPLQLHPRLDGLHLDLPLQGGTRRHFLLEHEDEVARLADQAPSLWSPALSREGEVELPESSWAASALYVVAALVACGPLLLQLLGATISSAPS